LITSITLPNSVTNIPDYAFAESFNLTKVELGNAVSSIGTGAFRSAGIVSISLPTSLRILANNVFQGSALTSLIIPVGTTTVGSSLSLMSIFTSVTIPNTVTVMQPYALKNSGVNTVNYCGNNASVLRAISNASSPVLRITPTCVAPATAP
jgi:hypothetical protein